MRHLLVIKPSSLGDIVMGLQAVQSFKAQLGSELKVTWVAGDIFADFVRACPLVDEVLVFERKGGMNAFLRLIKSIRSHGPYEAVLDMQGLARTGVMAYLSACKRRIGRTDCREMSFVAYTHRAPLPPKEDAHALEVLLQFALPLKLRPEASATLLPFVNQKAPKLSASSPRIMLFPDTRGAGKKWPRYEELVQRLIRERPDASLIWASNVAYDSPLEWVEAGVKNLSGQIAMRDLPGLIAQADLVVANDSGPMHIAAALQRPVLALFGPTNPLYSGPYPLNSAQNRYLQGEHKQIETLSVDTVLYAINGLCPPKDAAAYAQGSREGALL